MTTRLEKPVSRALKIRGVDYVIELAPAGIMFRIVRGRQRHVAPMAEVLALALEHSERARHRELLRERALQRADRGDEIRGIMAYPRPRGDR